MSHIGSQVKRRQSQSYKFKELAKISIFWNQHYTRHTFWSCLIRCANMKSIRWVLLKIQSGHDSVHRRTDGQTDKVKPVYPPFNFVEVGGIMKNISFWFKFQWRLFRSSNWQPVRQLVWVMAFSPLQTNQCWSSYIKPYGVNRPQWVNKHTNDSTVDKNRLNWTGIMKQSST